MKKQVALILSVLLMITGCHHEPGDSVPSVSWKALSDGSQFTVNDAGDTKFYGRCWQKSGKYDCLVVADQPTIKTQAVHRKLYDALPTEWDALVAEFGAQASGFSCNITENPNGYQQAVNKNGVAVASQLVTEGLEGQPWARDVAEYNINLAGVTGRDIYFNCGPVADALYKGGGPALGTTAIVYGKLDQ